MQFKVYQAESLQPNKGKRYFIDAGKLEPEVVQTLMFMFHLKAKGVIGDPVKKIKEFGNSIEKHREHTAIRLAATMDQRSAEEWSTGLQLAYQEFQASQTEVPPNDPYATRG